MNIFENEEDVVLEYEPTERGFDRFEFQDYNGKNCHLQKSSLATEDCIWLGCSELGLIYLPGNGTGWHPVENLPKTVQGNTAMHLTRKQAAALLPILTTFVLTGELTEDDDIDPEDIRQVLIDAVNHCRAKSTP